MVATTACCNAGAAAIALAGAVFGGFLQLPVSTVVVDHHCHCSLI